MSVGYSMEHSVIIKGTRAEFEKIPAVAQQVLEDHKAAVEKAKKQGRYFGWDSTWHYESLAEEITEIAKDALEADGEPLLMELESSDSDDTHGDFEDFLDGLDHKIPGLAIAVAATYVDTEYGEGDESNFYFSPSGTSKFNLGGENTGCLMGNDGLPDEDWIPYAWRHPNEKAPAAKAEGIVALLGDWSEAEKAIVDKALMGKALETMGYTAFEKGKEAVTRTEEGWEFSVGGAMDAGETAQNLHLAMLPYIEEHKASYAALCKAMREKKLAIHLYLDESTGPNAAWSYCNNSAWHFLITSDGARLVSKFTWCGTYGFGSRGGSVSCKDVYEHATGKKWYELSAEARFMASQAIGNYKAPVQDDFTDDDIEDFLSYLDLFGVDLDDFLAGNYDREEDFDDLDDDELADLQHQGEMMLKMEKESNSRMKAIIEEAVKNAPDLTPPARFIPQTFDQRFAGKTFIVKGDLDGYEEGQVKNLIEKFGGKVGRNVTANTAYFVCGSGVGDPFKTALKHGTPLLSADYFEDMTR